MHELDKIIREKLHVKRGDSLPYTGWNKEFSRNELAEMMGEFGYKKGAEIGVRKAAYSRVLCEKIPDLELFCVDPYMPYRGRRPSQERMDAYYEFSKNHLKDFNAKFIRKTSMDAVKDFEDESLDFVYIDAMHEFDPVMLDIIYWTPKVRVGGIVSGHDYVESYQCGVINAVRAYTYAHNIADWYLTYDYRVHHELVFSWFWVKA